MKKLYINLSILLVLPIFTSSSPPNNDLESNILPGGKFNQESKYCNDSANCDQRIGPSPYTEEYNQGSYELSPLKHTVSLRDRETEDILDILQQGEKEVELQPGKDVIVVLGYSGSGKSTLTLFISGHSEDMVSYEVTPDSGDFIIIDKSGKVSDENTTTKSQTTFPELLTDVETNSLFYDCPGFSDSRGAKNDIAATYFIKKIIEAASRVKFLFVISHYSVSSGMDRKGYNDLAEQATKLIKNIDKFEDSIALIATKVENRFIRRQLVPDEKVINNIANFLKAAKDAKLSESKPDYKVVKFTDILMQQNNDGEYSKIGIFRKPDEPGPLDKVELLKEGKPYLKKLIHANIQYAEHEKGDFGYTISPESKLKVLSLTEKLNDIIASDILTIKQDLETVFLTEEKKLNDLKELVGKFQEAYNKFSALKEIKTPKSFVEQLVKMADSLDISISRTSVENILKYDKFLEFLKDFSDKQADGLLTWMQEYNVFVKYLSDTKNWYTFLLDLLSKLSKYSVQKNVRTYENVTANLKRELQASRTESEAVLKTLKLFLDSVIPLDSEIEYGKLKQIVLNDQKLKKLNLVLDFALKNNTQFLIDEQSKKLTITGHFIKLSDISNALYDCPKYVEIFSLEKIFIDINNVNCTGKTSQLSIIAPTWEINGRPEIILDGAPGEEPVMKKARDAIAPTEKGKDGEPGKPGESAGNFFGIGNTLIRGVYLQVSAVGGKGGRGQNGGNGKDGKNGTFPGFPAVNTKQWPGFNYTCSKPEYLNGDGRTHYSWYRSICTVHGANCTNGTNAGDGGSGGIGGRAGKIITIALDNDSDIEPISAQGETGASGLSGKLGVAGKSGTVRKFTIVETRGPQGIDFSSTPIANTTTLNCTSGKPGTDGKNAQGIQQLKATELQSPSKIVNSYKYFMRKNINGVRGSFLKQFLGEMEWNKSVMDLYDMLGFLDELYRLERQYYELNTEFSFLPYYTSLLDRINKYAEKRYKSGLSQQDKKVLGYLYTTTLSKICNIKDNVGGELVIDLKVYLHSAKRDIEVLKKQKEIQASYESFKKYNESMNSKTTESLKFINDVVADIGNTLDDMEDQVESFIEEVIEAQNETIDKMNTLAEEEAKLRKQMAIQAFLRIMKVSSQFLSFAGPVGQAAGSAMGGVSMVVESIALSDEDEVGDKLKVVISAVDDGAKKINGVFEEKKRLLSQQLADAREELEKFTEDPSPTTTPTTFSGSVKEIQKKIANVQEELNAEKKRGATLDPASLLKIQSHRKELEDLMQEKIKKLESEIPSKEKKSDSRIKIFERVQNIMSMAEISIELYQNLKKDGEKLAKAAAAMKVAKNNLEALYIKEENIYNTLLPACRDIGRYIDETAKDLKGKSHSFLDVQKWKVQQTLKSLKTTIKEMAQDSGVEEDFMEDVNKLDEAMSVMIDLYNQIEDHRDKAELASYISDITSAKAANIRIDDPELQTAINNLGNITLSNLVVQEYYSAFSAFKQYAFPFASFFSYNYTLPPYLLGKDNTDSFIDEAINKILGMEDKITKLPSVLGKYDKNLHQNAWFNSKSRILEPFYVWKNDTNKNIISDLLTGKVVSLKADIRQGLKLNAIKFNAIGIRFNLLDSSLQPEFDSKLRDFKVTMTHWGNSYYRCHDQYYVMNSPQQQIKFSFNQKRGEPEDTNAIYDKIKRNDPVLSPYAMWSIRLSTFKGNFDALKSYRFKPMNLELEGQGQYVDSNRICTKDLEDNYELDKESPEINNISF